LRSIATLRAVALLAAALSLAAPSAAARQAAEGPDDVAELKSYESSILRGQIGRDTAEPLDEYLGDFPKSARALTLRATLLRRRGRYEEAEADLAKARASEPRDLEVRVALAIATFDLAFERGQVAAAEESLLPLLQEASAEGGLAPRLVAPLASRYVVLLCATGRRAAATKWFAASMKDEIAPAEDPAYALEYARALAALRQHERAARLLVPLENLLRDQSDPHLGECLLLLGRVYRVGHSGGDNLPAIKALKDALVADRAAIEACVELARARLFRFENDDADAAVQEALAIHDRHPAIWAARGEILLYDQRGAEGLAAAERALTEDPRHPGALAVQAVALWLLGKKPDAQKALAKLVEQQPDDGEYVSRFADVLGYLNRFREAIPIYRRALQADPQWGVAWVGLARCLVNTGDLEGAIEALNEFRRVDRVPYALADNVSIALQKLASFVEVRRGTFTYVMHPIEAPVLVPLLEEAYGRAWPDLCRRWSFDPKSEVRIECFPKHDDFSARTVGFTGFGALGVCFGSVFTLVSPRSTLRGQFVFDKTAVHELAHVVTLGLSKSKVPRWLTEGISVHEEHVYSPTGDREMDLDLYNYFHSGEIVPVRELNRVFAGPKILFGYYQGGLLCDFLVELRGEQVLVQMLQRFAKDEETPAAVQAVLGMSCEELDRQFLAWIERTKIAPMKVQPIYTEAGRRRLLDRARAAEKPPAALLAQVAWAYHAANRAVDRDDFLNQALAADPRLPSAHFLLAERALGARRQDEAIAEFEKGFGAGGDEFFARLRHAQLLLGKVAAGERRGAGARGEADPHAGGDEEEKPPELDAAARAAREKLLELFAKAKACFPRFVGDNNPYVVRARLLRELGREDESYAELEAFCAIDESDLHARQLLAKRALARGEWAAARRWLNDVRMIDPFQRAVWRDVARCDKELKEPALAITRLEVALQIDPSTEPDYDPTAPDGTDDPREARTRAELWLDLAELRAQVGEAESARAALEEARRLTPDAPRVGEVQRLLDGG